ncbi:MAG TPA: sulfite exporter TauE/SafE family protein [bacterium]|nr:sulfite exporter TauE/SafE family protein [bacterium]HOG43652.1 sulfite exporter TauE/SafE family protein [bacterium]HQM84746.1 sulfite exporter TauE/SafE family protein [bacterium]
MIQFLTEGFLLGLTLGTTCLVTCAPVYGSLILSKENNVSTGVKTVFLISAGRFLSYALFGLLTGYAGTLIGDLPEKETVIAVSYFLVAAYLTYSALIQNRMEKGCCAPSRITKIAGNPFLIGVLTGISICPAFVGAIARGIETGGMTGGVMLFTGFFFGTTVYLLPLSFLSYFTKKKVFRYVGMTASILVACWFVYDGSSKLYDRFNSYILNFTEVPVQIISTVPESYLKEFNENFNIVQTSETSFENIEPSIDSSQNRDIILITGKDISKQSADNIKKMNKNVLHMKITETQDIEKQIEFIRFYSFKGRRSTGFFYSVPVE